MAFEDRLAEVHRLVAGFDGWMKPRELDFLFLVAAHPTARGDILEIGSFRGCSTIALVKAAELAGHGRVSAVDPLPNERSMLPDENGVPSARAAIDANLRGAGVIERVEFHQMKSAELAPTWDRKLRLLWIDGDHSYAGAKTDYDLFAPHLSDGAIIAFHDVLHYHEGPVRVFSEDVLLSKHFGAAGLCGSIGWAQYFEDPVAAAPFRGANRALYERLQSLVPYVAFGERPRGRRRLQYRFHRARVPHRRVDREAWVRSVSVHAAPELSAV